MSEDILVMKKSLIASLVISSIAFTGLGSVSSSFAQSTPASEPTMTPAVPGGTPTTPSSGETDKSVPGGTMPIPSPDTSPDMLKKPVKKNVNKKNVKKKKKTTSNSTVPASKTAKPATSGY
jgi:hypothetical protein